MLKTLNPHLLRATTPRNVRQYPIWIPQDCSANVEQVQKQLASLRVPAKHIEKSKKQKPALRYHLVRRGENLGLIARRYGFSVPSLKRMNGLRSSRIYAGKRLLVSGALRKPTTIIHRVRSGDALTLIASRYRIPVRKLKLMNDLRTNRIYVGQRLVITKGI